MNMFIEELAQMLESGQGETTIIIEASDELDCQYDPVRRIAVIKGPYHRPKHRWVFLTNTDALTWTIRLSRVCS